MIDALILAFTTTIRKLPESIVPPAHVGTAAPAARSELPAVAVGLAQTELSVSGIGGVVLEQESDPAQWEQRFARRLSGRLRIDVYAAAEAEALSLATEVLQLLGEEAVALRGEGVLRMGAAQWDRVAATVLPGETTDPDAKRQTLELDFVFERVQQETPGPGGVITEVRAEIEPPVEEDFQIN